MPNNRKKLTIPAPEVGSVTEPPSPNGKSGRTRAEQLFAGEQPVNTEAANDPPTMRLDVTLDLPEHADPSATGRTAKDAKDAVDAVINALGTEKMEQTMFPVAKSKNNGMAAANYVLWDHVNRRVAKIFEAATEQADREGVFGDKDSYVEGETSMTFNSAEYSISVKKNGSSKMIDKTLVEAVLREVAPSKWQELYDKCFKPRAGAAMRIVSLK